MQIIRLLSNVCFIFFCLTLQVQATTFYVAQTGNNGSPGSDARPWATLQHAAQTVSAGDTVIIRSGTYQGFRATSGGTAGHPITFKADEAASVVIDSMGPDNRKGSIIEIEEHDWWVLQGLEVTNAPDRAGIDIRVADHVTVRNCNCHHNQKWGIFTAFAEDFTAEYNRCSYSAEEHGIYHSNSGDRAVIRYNTCHNNHACGIQINADPSMGGDGISSNNTLSFNILYENGNGGGAAINLASVRDSLIYNNLMYNNHAGGIAAWDDGQGQEWGSRNNQYYNNTIHMPSNGRWAINIGNGSTGCRIFNNIMIHENSARGGLEVDASSLTGLVSDYNILGNVSVDENTISLSQWRSAYSHDTHSLTATAAETVNAPGTDYHLKADSPARDGGTALVEISTDIEGVVRPAGAAYDIGAYEYNTGTNGENPDDGNTPGQGDNPPVLTLLINGGNTPLTISSGTLLSLSIGLNSADFSGKSADWWIVRISPSGIFYFDLNQMAMREGLNPTFQGPLMDISPFQILAVSDLEPGIHDFYFAIDMPMNGSLDTGAFYYSNLRIEITPATVGPGHITYRQGNQIFRIRAQGGATPENITQGLNALSPLPAGGEDSNLNISPDGNWLIMDTERFNDGCRGWACLAAVKSDLSSGEAIIWDGNLIHPEGFPAIASGGNLVVYPNRNSSGGLGIWAVKRSGNNGQWGTPVELTKNSDYDWNYWPAISQDGTRVVFNCTDEPYTDDTSICEVGTDGTGFRRVLHPSDSPPGFPDSGELHSPDFAPDGSIIFEASWEGEQIWKLPPGTSIPLRITDEFHNDNSPCVLPDGSIASLWLDRPGASGGHELKIMAPDGSSHTMLIKDIDLFDIGLGCGN